MVVLVRNGKWGLIQRPVSLAGPWPGDKLSSNEESMIATGPVNLDLYALTREFDNLVDAMAGEVERAGIQLQNWTEEDVVEFRRAVWRSAHRYVTNHVNLVDRSPELKELAKILKVDS